MSATPVLGMMIALPVLPLAALLLVVGIVVFAVLRSGGGDED